MIDTLKKYFGLDSFRPGQREIIEHVASGRDSLVIMPTGGGKSLCFQLPALLRPGVTLVVSPLIALMKDQVDGLRNNGVSAAFLNSSLSVNERMEVEQAVLGGQVKLLYLAPERFSTPGFREFLENIPVGLIAIDEAHCISEWGHDFRPEYRNLRNLRQYFPDVPIVALTATATGQVQTDIISQLGLTDHKTFLSGFNRTNLFYSVVPKQGSLAKLLELLNKFKDESVIIYCFSRNETERVASVLKSSGFRALPYHAGMSSEDRSRTQEKFIRSDIDIIVATVAFGMGIDKPDVRLVVHLGLPKSVEGYYQETGRAGRDGLPSECVLFYSAGDLVQQGRLIQMITDSEEQQRAWQKLYEVRDYAQSLSCRRKFLLNYFGEDFPTPCDMCDMCVNPPEEFDATEVAQKILSAVIKTEQRFGKGHVISVLLGKENEKVLQFGHNNLSVFGIVKDYSKSQLEEVFGSLLAKDLLEQTAGQYPILRVTPMGMRWLRERKVLHIPKVNSSEVKEKREKKEKKTVASSTEFPELYQVLSELRKRLADEQGVPPYVVFSNVSLIDMTNSLPQSLESFANINGVGEQKLLQYGEKFVEVIRNFAEPLGFSERTTKKEPAPQQRVIREKATPTHLITKQFILERKSLAEIANERGIKEGTVIAHIEVLLEQEPGLDIEYLKPDAQRLLKIQDAYLEAGTEFLAPVKQLLDESFSYDEIRLARLFIK